MMPRVLPLRAGPASAVANTTSTCVAVVNTPMSPMSARKSGAEPACDAASAQSPAPALMAAQRLRFSRMSPRGATSKSPAI